VKVTLAQSTHTLGQAPLDIALLRGFFKDEGIDLDNQQQSSGATVSASLVSDEIQFGEFGSSDVVLGAEKGLGFVGVSQIAGGLTQTFAIRKEFAAERIITDETPLEEIPEYTQYVDPRYAEQLMSESMPSEEQPASLPRKGPVSETAEEAAGRPAAEATPREDRS
jgi:hypothetical protein